MPESLNSMDVNVFQQPIDSGLSIDFLDETPEEVDQVWVLVIDAEEQTIEQTHGVVLDVPGEVADAVDDVQVQRPSLLRHLLAQAVDLLEAVLDFVMEVHFNSELFSVVILDFLGNDLSSPHHLLLVLPNRSGLRRNAWVRTQTLQESHLSPHFHVLVRPVVLKLVQEALRARSFLFLVFINVLSVGVHPLQDKLSLVGVFNEVFHFIGSQLVHEDVLEDGEGHIPAVSYILRVLISKDIFEREVEGCVHQFKLIHAHLEGLVILAQVRKEGQHRLQVIDVRQGSREEGNYLATVGVQCGVRLQVV
mmetsp:Transcript_12390/g.19302  ORF Transcript_12390/g.19302 Transcript_12390/m.19302 type:complete len:306 (-) Transcript_12390:1848-2765(-)|eukprot:CAMPEP_0170485794 /NCGR_PEP_ID=MMETSP0208-20121228/4965_1 /TAXON_ID=197538 /ORGANISM="Strombidium inclinatum, Strain S3" /LENGTH=305 /DNA_ID=CAMNT_0010759535 /DNA_START=409 /DNA_END=1326 /DNA_ORIENTATION=-